MPRKSFTPEQIIAKLRLTEVAMGSGKTAQLACKEGQYFRAELLPLAQGVRRPAARPSQTLQGA